MNSNNGLITKIWGPGGWTFMHSITFGYPINPTNEQKKQYKHFFESVGDVLPCSYCRESYKNFILTGKTKLTDEVMENRESLTKWLYFLHEAVNRKLGVDYGVSYNDVANRYESYRAICNSLNDTHAVGCLKPRYAGSYEIANNIDCPIIFPDIAKEFIEYAKLRGISDEEIALIDKLESNVQSKNRNIDVWCLRNKECRNIILEMRLNGISPLEPSDSKWAGLPTIKELQLITRLSSNLSNNELSSLICKLQSSNSNVNCKKNNKKTYRLVKS